MSDAELVAALGWTECTGDGQWCDIHGSNYSGQEYCAEMIDRLDHAEQGMALVTPILLDLIAELRATIADNEADFTAALAIGEAADHAEARLREVTGDE